MFQHVLACVRLWNWNQKSKNYSYLYEKKKKKNKEKGKEHVKNPINRPDTE